MGEVTDISGRIQAIDSTATDKALFVRTSGMEIVESLIRET